MQNYLIVFGWKVKEDKKNYYVMLNLDDSTYYNKSAQLAIVPTPKLQLFRRRIKRFIDLKKKWIKTFEL